MPPVTRKTAVPEAVNFLDPSFYAPAGGIPEGNYALMFDVRLHQATDKQGQAKGPERLGVMITAYAITPDGALLNPGADPLTQFYSFGKNAHLSYAPNPETGKGIVAIPGGPGGKLNDSTNWAVFLENLRSSGLPEGIAVNDLSVFDGMWVHMTQIPEPESRKSMQSNMGEGEGLEGPRRPGTISVVSEFLPGGEPWEGGGGIPEAGAAPAPKAVAKPALAKPGPKPVAKTPAKAPAKSAPAQTVAEEEPGDEETLAVASNAAASVVEKPANANGLKKAQLRVGMFKIISDEHGSEVANAILGAYFASDDALNTVIGPLGYVVSGQEVKLA